MRWNPGLRGTMRLFPWACLFQVPIRTVPVPIANVARMGEERHKSLHVDILPV